MSARLTPLNCRSSHQSLIGRKAAAPTMSTATTAHTPTMAKPRRRSAPFCFLRMSSMTARRLFRAAVFLATVSAFLGYRVGVVQVAESLRTRWSHPCKTAGLGLHRPAEGERERPKHRQLAGGHQHRAAVPIRRSAGQGRDRLDELLGRGGGPERRPVLGPTGQGTDDRLAGAVAEEVGSFGSDQRARA